MLNYKDYYTAFNVLDETFRTNQFKDLQGFIDYARKNFSATQYINIVEKTEENQDENNLLDTAAQVATGNVNVKLGEGTDFTMSFTFTLTQYD